MRSWFTQKKPKLIRPMSASGHTGAGLFLGGVAGDENDSPIMTTTSSCTAGDFGGISVSILGRASILMSLHPLGFGRD